MSPLLFCWDLMKTASTEEGVWTLINEKEIPQENEWQGRNFKQGCTQRTGEGVRKR